MQIQLKNNQGTLVYTKVLQEDFEQVSKFAWCLSTSGYAIHKIHGLLHHYIMGKPREGFCWDHKDNDRLNNQRCNLREVTYAQNAQNSKKKENTSSQYLGVGKMDNKWSCRIRGKRLGCFGNEIDAGKLYDKAALFVYGSGAKTNGLLTLQEIEDALKLTELPSIVKNPKSIYGKGICFTNRNKYRVSINGRTIGEFKTLEEAQKVASNCYKKIQDDKNEFDRNRVIERDENGKVILTLTGVSGIVGYTYVDEEHWRDVARYAWHKDNKNYAVGTVNGKVTTLHKYIYHTYIGEIPKKHVIDHIGQSDLPESMKSLDNRICNLRAVSQSVNCQNRIVNKNATSKYLGVSFDRGNKKWISTIQKDKVQYYLGRFSTEREAAEKYNEKATELYGVHAKLNVLV